MKNYNVAIVGATGNIGHSVLSVLYEREFPINTLFAISGQNSRGKKVSFGDRCTLTAQSIDDVDFSNIDICFMCAGSSVSKKYGDKIAKSGCSIIDKTSYFRLFKDVPLIVPEINGTSLEQGAVRGIISTPNCIAVPLAMALCPINRVTKVKRAVVSTYQSVSGAGRLATDELYNQTKSSFFGKAAESHAFQKTIAFNVLPEIGDVLADGSTDEEDKIKREMCKIFSGNIKISVTSVRVPVFIGHGISVACELSHDFNISDIVRALQQFPGVRVVNGLSATPLDAQSEDDVFVSRMRVDDTVKHGLLMWIVTDNLRKGAALNGVQIAEKMVEIDASLRLFKRSIS